MVYIVRVSGSTLSYCGLLLIYTLGCPFYRFTRHNDSGDLEMEDCLNVVYGYTRSVEIYIFHSSSTNTQLEYQSTC